MIEGVVAVVEKIGEVVVETAEKAGEAAIELAEKTGEKVSEMRRGFTEDVVMDERELLEGISKEGKICEPDMEVIMHRSLESVRIENQSEYIRFGDKEGIKTYSQSDTDLEKVSGVNEKVVLSDAEKTIIKDETGWSDDIIEHIDNMDQYEIYKNADLYEAEIDGRKCLIKDIDMELIDPKTGMTNRKLMEIKGRSPIDARTGEKIELHHMGQDYNSPFAELCENSEHGDGNHSVLHPKTEESWRNNSDLKYQYNNVDKPNHWKERAREA